jgi:hypothetical protein
MDLLAARELVDGNLVTVLTEHTRLGPPLSIVHTPAAQRLARVRVFSGFQRLRIRRRCGGPHRAAANPLSGP